jgi:hypothetical protein
MVGRKSKVIKMSFIENEKQGIDPKIALKLTPELKGDYFQDLPFKLEECTIESWKVISVPIEDCNPSLEKPYFLYTPVLLDKEGKYRYFKLCEKPMQEQTSALDQQLGDIHKIDCTIVDENGNTEVKPLFLQIDTDDRGDKF